MEWMLAEEDDSVVYDYEKVKHWSDGIAGGLFGQKNLFVPVNISNTHWIFLRADLDSKTIELYDSMGVQTRATRSISWHCVIICTTKNARQSHLKGAQILNSGEWTGQSGT